MKTKQKWCLGFVVMAIATIITLTSCDLFADDTPEFPSRLRGTWDRAGPSAFTSTRTISADRIQNSHQSIHWRLTDVSGDRFTVQNSNNPNQTITYTLIIVDGDLHWSGCGAHWSTSNEACDGIWVRR